LASDKPTAAFIISLIAGIINILSGLLLAPYESYSGYGMMSGYYEMMKQVRFGVFEIAFGVLVIVSAVMLRKRPTEHATWGVLIILFSIFSAGALTGVGNGFILGLIGGILAIIWKPPTTATVQS